MAKTSTTVVKKKKSLGQRIIEDWQLILLALPGVIYFIIFKYGPMYGLQIAFKDYGIFQGINASPWAEPVTKHFIKFFSQGDFWILLRNTLLLSVYTKLFAFPVPILFAVFLNEVRNLKFKKTVQTITYLPSLLSVVVVCSMVIDMLSPSIGIFNRVISALGGEKIYFMIKPEWYRTIYIGSGIWSGYGYNAVVYIAALSNIDPQLYEAAKIDGCTRLKLIWHVTLPGIIPTIVTMFIMGIGSLIKSSADKAILLYNPATYSVADTFATYVYRKGIIEANYSFSTAVGLFESVVALILILTTNYLSRKLTETSLW